MDRILPLLLMGLNMEMSNSNKTMCEEIFGGELDVTDKTTDSFESDKSQVRQYRDWLHERNERQLEILQKMESALEKMESFSRSKKNMHPPIRDGIQEAKKELGALRYDMEDTVCYLDSFEYLMRGLLVHTIKEARPPKSKEVADEGSQTLPQPAARFTPEKTPSKTPEKPRRARPEAVLIKPAEGMSYASILRELKKRVNPDELGATVQGIRETRSKDLLVELKCSIKSRRRPDTAFKEAVGDTGAVRHLISRIEVEITDPEPTIGVEDVEDAIRSYFDQGLKMLKLKVSLSKTPYRGNRKAYVLLEEAKALKLLKGAHIKIGWVSCRVRRKKEVNRCFRWLRFGHIAPEAIGEGSTR